jgi:hypothetical protein
MSKKGKTLLNEKAVARFMELAKIDDLSSGFINENFSKTSLQKKSSKKKM